MSDFDPKDVIGRPNKKSDFDPEDIVSPTVSAQESAPTLVTPALTKEPTPTPREQPDPILAKEPTPVPNKNNNYETQFLKKEEVKAIADKYGVPEDVLLSRAPYRGGVLPPKSLGESLVQGAKGTVGAVDRGVLFGVGSFIDKKMQDPKTRLAIDELDKLIEQRRGWEDFGQEVALGVGSTAGQLAKTAIQKAPTLLDKVKNVGKSVGTGTGLGGLAGLTSSDEGEELAGAATGAGLGAGLILAPVAVGGGIKTLKKGADWFSGLGQKVKEISPELIEKATVSAEAKLPQILADDNKIAETLGLDPKNLKAQDPALLKEKVKQALMVEEVTKEPVKANYASTWGEEGLKLFGRAKQNLRIADTKHGTNLEPLANKVSAGEKQYLWDMNELYNKHKEIKKGPSALTEEQVFSILNAPKDQGAKLFNSLSPEGKQQVDNYRQAFEWGREKANSGKDALQIPVYGKTFGYVPAKSKQGPDAVIAFQQQFDSAAKSLGLSKDEFVSKLDDPTYVNKLISDKEAPTKEVGELLKGLKYISPNEEFKLNNYADFSNAVQLALDPTNTGAGKDYLQAGALFRRDNVDFVLPDFLREKNVDRLLQNWGSDVFRYKHMRLPMEQIRGQALAIKQKGDIATYKYINNYLEDLAGTRDTFGRKLNTAATKWETALKQKADAVKEKDPALSKTLEFAAGVPDMLHMASQQLYPFYLGLRVDKAARNLTQPYMLTAGEISGGKNPGYGYKKILQNMKSYLPGTESRKQMQEYLKENGQIGPEFVGEQIRWMRDGIKASGLGSEALEKANKVAMYLYSKSDLENRILTGAAAKSVIEDLFSGNTKLQQQAVDSIKSWAPSYKKAIEKAYLNKDQALARKLATEYLIDTTQFNYDKASMSNYGRYMGGLFNMFSTWPSAIGGDLYLQTRGISGDAKSRMQKNTTKYLGPLIAMVAAQKLYEGTETDQTPAGRQLAGKDLVSVAPVSSLSSVASGQLGPPALSEPVKTVTAIAKGDTVGIEKQAGKLKGLLPGAVYYERVVNDLPDWLEIFSGSGLEPQEQYKLSPLEGEKVPSRGK